VVTEQGEYRVAQQLLRESLSIFRDLGDQEGMMRSLIALGYVTWVLGEYETAKQLHEESLALCRDTGNQAGIAHSLEFLAQAVFGLAEYEKAKQLWYEGLAIHKEIGNLRGVVGVLADLGEAALVLGEYEEAARLAQQSLALHKKLDDRFGIAWSLRVLGNAACGLGDLEGARKHLCQALEKAVMVRWTSVTLLALVGIGALLAAEGEKERALELTALILHHPLSWRWTKDRAARLVAELESELPHDVAAAAQERGRVRDLEATVAELLVELDAKMPNEDRM
jgi:tetratricopeptide (TPR) repeat protein